MKPNFESPVHTARDMVERGITLYLGPDQQLWKQWLSLHDDPDDPENSKYYRKIAESIFITAKSYEQYNAMTKNELLSRGTHAMMQPYMAPYQLAYVTEIDDDQGVTIVSTEYMTQKGEYKYNHGRGYYRGEKLIGKIPETGYLTNKKWHRNEVFARV